MRFVSLKTKFFSFIGLLTLLLTIFFSVYYWQQGKKLLLSKQGLEQSLNYALREPSGITYHVTRDSFFIIGDRGDLYEVKSTGKLKKKKKIRLDFQAFSEHITYGDVQYKEGKKKARLQKFDFEGITFNPENERLYLLEEGRKKIFEVTAKRKPKVKRIFDLHDFIEKDLDLMEFESITYLPGQKNSLGHLLLADKHDVTPTTFYEVALPRDDASDKKLKLINTFQLDTVSITGLHYEQSEDAIYAISDVSEYIYKISRHGELIKLYPVSGTGNEGIALNREGQLYVVQDHHKSNGTDSGKLVLVYHFTKKN